MTGLACRRGDRLLLRDLSFDVQPGQVLWVRGANGRGKTSLLRLLAGLGEPEAGRVERLAPRLYIGHANALKDDLKALEALRFMAQLHGQPADAAACQAALRSIGLPALRNAPVRTLSQGQRRRVALARLFMLPSAALWILDEPYDALDTHATAILNAALAAHVASGGAVVLTSHVDLSLEGTVPRILQLDEQAGAR